MTVVQYGISITHPLHPPPPPPAAFPFASDEFHQAHPSHHFTDIEPDQVGIVEPYNQTYQAFVHPPPPPPAQRELDPIDPPPPPPPESQSIHIVENVMV